ncbi:MAG: acetyl-CoA carboxylase biotin carboxyl carrier protein [Oscillospiraceae bacterium]|nr:acetyl-CoA carboxylase biotin carboxyl carrier protein [Oscillospiraceae bacterium]
MELEKIRALASVLTEFGLEELKLQASEGWITLRRPRTEAVVAPVLPQAAAPVQMTSVPPAEDTVPVVEEPASAMEEAELVTVTSPVLGMFYIAPSPDDPPFVSVGQAVKAGDILCVIEAMKLMNEITAEQDGVITQCYHGNGQLVEFGQPLFQMRCE